MPVTEIIHCHGHTNVLGRHKSTFEITKETELSKNGDCIIAVGADKGYGFIPGFREAISHEDAVLPNNSYLRRAFGDIISQVGPG